MHNISSRSSSTPEVGDKREDGPLWVANSGSSLGADGRYGSWANSPFPPALSRRVELLFDSARITRDPEVGEPPVPLWEVAKALSGVPRQPVFPVVSRRACRGRRRWECRRCGVG